MSLLTITALRSGFARAPELAIVEERIRNRLAEQGIEPRSVTPDELRAAAGEKALLILTGGTEKQASELASDLGDPVLLLAHETHNSLPAALEILAHLQQTGRRGRVFHLGPGGEAGSDLQRALLVIGARRRLFGRRVGRIGTPSDWLVASAPEDGAVANEWQIEIEQIERQELLATLAEVAGFDTTEFVRSWREGAVRCVEPKQEDLTAAGHVYAALKRIIERHRLDACTVRCFDLVTDLHTTGCLALSQLIDEGVVAGCEGDLPAALTMLWMQALTGQKSFMANPQEVLSAENCVALAHCTVARRLCSRYALRSHFESGLGAAVEGDFAASGVTLSRLGGPHLTELFVSDGEVIASQRSAERCRTQILVRLEDDVRQLLLRPLGNHHVVTPGHWKALAEEYQRLFLRAPQSSL